MADKIRVEVGKDVKGSSDEIITTESCMVGVAKATKNGKMLYSLTPVGMIECLDIHSAGGRSSMAIKAIKFRGASLAKWVLCELLGDAARANNIDTPYPEIGLGEEFYMIALYKSVDNKLDHGLMIKVVNSPSNIDYRCDLDSAGSLMVMETFKFLSNEPIKYINITDDFLPGEDINFVIDGDSDTKRKMTCKSCLEIEGSDLDDPRGN